MLGNPLTRQHFCTMAFFTVDHALCCVASDLEPDQLDRNHSDKEIADRRKCSDRQATEEVDAHGLEHTRGRHSHQDVCTTRFP